jgi:N6-L-threonylcarbamoyladenine synthase
MPNFILAIDTSCDDTSASVVADQTVYSNVVASQTELHKEFGGVFPTVAKQAHRENIQPVVELALKRAGITHDQVIAVAVTQGPGLAPALEVGIEYAKQLANQWSVPFVPVNHMEGHVLSVLANGKPKKHQLKTVEPLQLFALFVVVSGGHTEFILVKEAGVYERVGWTVDDAAGEALDKFGRMVDLGYPAGPLVEQFAKLGDERAFRFPLPMTTTDNFLMSFSGLKTAVRKKVEELTVDGPLTTQQMYDLCASFQYAVFHAITYKLNKYLSQLKSYHPEQFPQSVWLGGGVAANVKLRQMLRETIRPFGLELRVPYSKKVCSDNGAMIGVAASYKIARRQFADPRTIERIPRWEIDQLK